MPNRINEHINALIDEFQTEDARQFMKGFLSPPCEISRTELIARHAVACNALKGCIGNADEVVHAYEWLVESAVEMGAYDLSDQYGLGADQLGPLALMDDRQRIEDAKVLRRIIDDAEFGSFTGMESDEHFRAKLRELVGEEPLIRMLRHYAEEMLTWQKVHSGQDYYAELTEYDALDTAEEAARAASADREGAAQ